jgi:hypothetical protein
MEVTALATELFKRKEFIIEMHMVIDGVGVSVHIDLEDRLRVESADTEQEMYRDEEEYDVSSIELVSDAILKVRSKLENLYYYKPMGKMLSKENTIDLLTHKVFKKFAMPTEDCCVCFEETSCSTKCNHFCCHKCLQKVNRCPVCRQDLYE